MLNSGPRISNALTSRTSIKKKILLSKLVTSFYKGWENEFLVFKVKLKTCLSKLINKFLFLNQPSAEWISSSVISSLNKIISSFLSFSLFSSFPSFSSNLSSRDGRTRSSRNLTVLVWLTNEETNN